ncbi:hypothetical protein DL768_001486 [Monosporascus sp. mg162]|nr:hypothetical protein DL768_001486 [Monosporascus sp. mg162]
MAISNEKWVRALPTTNAINNNRAAAARTWAARTKRLAAERAPAVAAAAGADAAAAAAAAVTEPELERERESTPTPVPPAPVPPMPETPARPPRQRPARSVYRAVPYFGCLRFTLTRRSTSECFDAVVKSRCWRYRPLTRIDSRNFKGRKKRKSSNRNSRPYLPVALPPYARRYWP